jgi:hypothetical protein
VARSFAQVYQSMDRSEQLEDLYVTSVKVSSIRHGQLLMSLRIESSSSLGINMYAEHSYVNR